MVTEYGIADLRGKCDHEVIEALLNIAVSDPGLDQELSHNLLTGPVGHKHRHRVKRVGLF